MPTGHKYQNPFTSRHYTPTLAGMKAFCDYSRTSVLSHETPKRPTAQARRS